MVIVLLLEQLAQDPRGEIGVAIEALLQGMDLVTH